MRFYISKNCLNALIIILVFISVLYGENDRLRWRIFTKDPNVWVYNRDGLILFSSQSRTIKTFEIDASRSIDSLLDCIEGEGYLWVSSNTGIYQIDMGTQSVERLPSPPEDTTVTGKIALDADYLWIGTKDKLFRFDRLAREWLSFSLPSKVERVIGLWTNGNEVFVLGNNILYRFTTSTEKWNQYPLEKPFSENCVFYPGKDGFKVLDGSGVFRYQPSSLVWTSININSTPDDIFDEDSVVYFCRENEIFSINIEKEALYKINLPSMKGVSSFTKVKDSLLIITNEKIVKGSIKTLSVNFTEYPDGLEASKVNKIIFYSKFILVFTNEFIYLYDQSNKAWERIKTKEFSNVKFFRWNEEGLTLNYTKNISSKLTGSVQSVISLKSKGYEYDTIVPADTIIRNDSMIIRKAILDTTDSILVMELKDPILVGNLNLHTKLTNDRVMDIFFDNTSPISVPKKGVYYRGNRQDYLSNINIGTTNNDQMSSTLSPTVNMEGITGTIESKARLKERDKKIVSISAGTGYITTKSVWKILPYSTEGIYYLKSIPSEEDTTSLNSEDNGSSLDEKSDSTIIVPGSIKVFVDGEVLDSNFYTFSLQSGKLEFRNTAPIDPISVITVNYKIQTKPKNHIDEVEIIPTYFFKKLHFGSLTYSPTEWISSKVGISGIEESDTLFSIVNVSLPIEIRKKQSNLMIKALPEFSYNTKNGSMGGGWSLQSRIGEKVGIIFNGMVVDSNFKTTDTLTKGYGKSLNEYDFTFNYDITQELPLKFSHYTRTSSCGIEKKYTFNAGIQYPKYPFLDISLSRMKIENLEEEPNILDSVFNIKDKIGFRIYEKNSSFLKNITKLNKIGYDIFHSEYRYKDFNNDQWLHGRLTSSLLLLNPTQKISIINKIIYRGGMNFENAPSSDVTPLLQIQTFDAPPGVDLLAIYQLKYSKFSTEGISTDTINRSAEVILKPGAWLKYLNWFYPRGRISQNRSCYFYSLTPSPFKILNGNGDNFTQVSSYGIGANISPSTSFLIRNMNEWGFSEKTKKFSSTNDIQYWLDAKNYWQAIWNYSTDFIKTTQHIGNLSYNKIWFPWLRTVPSLQATFSQDSTGNTIRGGPKLTTNINIQKFLFIKNLYNSHDIFIVWQRKNGIFNKYPEWGYMFNLQLILFPNIQITNYESITFKNNSLGSLESRLNMVINF